MSLLGYGRSWQMFDTIQSQYYNNVANKKFEWFGEDNLENFKKHSAQPDTKKRLESSGWFNNTIVYQFNSHGFRGPEIDPIGDYFMSVGCSFTFGTAIQTEQRYADIVAEKLNMTSYNFGVQGGCDDTSFRLALTWLEQLTPKFLVYQNTFPQRFEVIDNDQSVIYGINAALGGSVAADTGVLYKQLLTNSANEQIRSRKNLMAMRELCKEKNVRLIEVCYIDFLKTHDNNARDMHHPGAIANQAVAEKILRELHG